jgi:hypothetical protein
MSNNGGNGDGTHGPEGERSADDALVALVATLDEGTHAIVDTVGAGLRDVSELHVAANAKVAAVLIAGIGTQERRVDALETRVKRLEQTLLELLKERAERGGSQ